MPRRRLHKIIVTVESRYTVNTDCVKSLVERVLEDYWSDKEAYYFWLKKVNSLNRVASHKLKTMDNNDAKQLIELLLKE